MLNMLCEGLKWRVSSGENISIWWDAWIKRHQLVSSGENLRRCVSFANFRLVRPDIIFSWVVTKLERHSSLTQLEFILTIFEVILAHGFRALLQAWN